MEITKQPILFEPAKLEIDLKCHACGCEFKLNAPEDEKGIKADIGSDYKESWESYSYKCPIEKCGRMIGIEWNKIPEPIRRRLKAGITL
jgi:rubredoxin